MCRARTTTQRASILQQASVLERYKAAVIAAKAWFRVCGALTMGGGYGGEQGRVNAS